jgi:CHAP domain-containing protein
LSDAVLVSLQTVVARISELNTLLAPPAAAVAPTTPAPPATSGTSAGGDSSQFASMLQGAMGPGATTGAAGTAAIPAGGSAGQKIVAIASREVGQAESPPGSNNSPRIAQYRSATAGSPGPGPWCAYFTSWAAKEAGVPVGPGGSGFGSVDALYSWAQGAGKALPRNATPQPGDLIVWDEHIGIVESVGPGGTVNTIEGNSSDRVSRRTHPAGSALGYVRLG